MPVMMQGFDWPTPVPTGMEKLPNYNGVHMSREYFDASIEKLLGMLKNANRGVKHPASSESRTENTYFFYADNKERRRLDIQRKLMKSFDEETYRKVAGEFDRLRILDLGSNNGDFVMDRIAGSDKTEKLVGLEFDQDAVVEGNRKYGQPGKIGFFQCNVESEDFAEQLEAIMEQMGRGVTNWDGEGAYTNKTSYILFVMISKYEVNQIKKIVHSIDPNAFMILTDGCSVDGNFEKRL